MKGYFEAMAVLQPDLKAVKYAVNWHELYEVLPLLKEAIASAGLFIGYVERAANPLNPEGYGSDFLKMLFEKLPEAPQAFEDIRGALDRSLRFHLKYGSIESVKDEDLRLGVERINKLKLLISCIHDPLGETVIIRTSERSAGKVD